MKTSVLLLVLLSLSAFSESHYLEILSAGFSGIPDFPNFIAATEADGIGAAWCDSNQTLKIKQDWIKALMRTDPGLEFGLRHECFVLQPNFFKTAINNLRQSFNQAEGVHILQMIARCEQDVKTGKVHSFMMCGYDGKEFIVFDAKRQTWMALRPEGLPTQLSWDDERKRLISWKKDFTQLCPFFLQTYAAILKSSPQNTVLPSVSLLQKSPSSPVSCHATGFFPDRAVMFWRRDGEELSKDVDPGEILPNHDGSFQISVDLLTLPSDDWEKYECVFQLSGVEEDQVYKLNKDKIRTNHNDPTVPVSVSVVLLLLLLVAAVVGSVFYRQRKAAKTRTEGPESTSMNTPSCSQPDQDHHNQEEEALNTETLS